MKITYEAVEAAVDAIVASKLGDHSGINGEEFVEAAHAALEAAAPHMLAAAWEAGAQAQAAAYGMDKDTGPNPYRSQA